MEYFSAFNSKVLNSCTGLIFDTSISCPSIVPDMPVISTTVSVFAIVIVIFVPGPVGVNSKVVSLIATVPLLVLVVPFT